MVERRSGGRPASHRLSLHLAPLAAAAMLLAQPCYADWRVAPSLSVTGTYTDNVTLQPDALAQSQFLTEYLPALAVTGSGERYKVEADTRWRHFSYHGTRRPGTIDSTHEYSFSGQGELARDLLFIEAEGASSLQSISAFGPQSGNNPYVRNNRTEVSTWRVSPHIEHGFGRSARMSLRYTRDSVDAGELNSYGRSLSDTFSAGLSSGAGSPTLGWGLNFLRQDIDSERAGSTSSTNIVSNLSYALNRRFALTATAGYDRYDYQSLGGRTSGRSWSAGFDWQPSLRTSLKASLGRHYFGKTGALNALHRSRRTSWIINYDDAVTTTRAQFTLPSTIDTASMLDSLFRAAIPDPVLRQQAVADYMRESGLPPSLADDINYLSNRYLRQKRLQASGALRLARSTAMLSLFRTERIALSSQQSDSDLLGSQLASLNDNVRQLGANLSAGYSFTPRSFLDASASYTRSLSLRTGIEDTRRLFRIGYKRELGKHMRAALEVRHHTGSVGINAGRYQENAISATLAAQL